MSDQVWYEGQRVMTIVGHFSSPILRRRIVKRVLKRFIELDDGSKWTLDGWKYPRERWAQQRIHEETPELVDQWWKARLVASAKRLDLTGLSKDRLLSVLAHAVKLLREEGGEKCDKIADEVETGIKQEVRRING